MLKKETVTKAVKAVLNGMSQSEASKKYGCSQGAISIRLSDSKYYRAETGVKKSTKITKAIEAVSSGKMTISDAARKYRCTRGGIYYRMNKNKR